MTLASFTFDVSGIRRTPPPVKVLAKPAGVGVLLEVKDLMVARSKSKELILGGLNISINEGEIHAVTGGTGSGLSSLAEVLQGDTRYEVRGGSVTFKGGNLFDLSPLDMFRVGLCVSFQTLQHQIALGNTTLFEFLYSEINSIRELQGTKHVEVNELIDIIYQKYDALNISHERLFDRLNAMSYIQYKLNEVLRLSLLEPELCILDDIETGLDDDQLRKVASLIKENTNSVLILTHSQRILDHLSIDMIHVMENGVIVKNLCLR